MKAFVPAPELYASDGRSLGKITPEEAARLCADDLGTARGSKSRFHCVVLKGGDLSPTTLAHILKRLPKNRPLSHNYETPTNPRGVWELRNLQQQPCGA